MKDFFESEIEDQNTVEETEIEVEETEDEAEEAPIEEPDTTVEEPETVEPTPAREEAPAQSRGDNFVPLAALMEEREKGRREKEAAEQLRSQIAEYEKAKLLNNGQPDPYDDPAAYTQYLRTTMMEEVRHEMRVENLMRCRDAAIAEHGSEYVETLADWVEQHKKTDPTFEERAFASANPVEFASSEKKRRDALEQMQSDPDEYVRRRALEMGLIPTVAPIVEAVEQQTTVAPTNSVQPRSLATMRGKGADYNTKGDGLFD